MIEQQLDYIFCIHIIKGGCLQAGCSSPDLSIIGTFCSQERQHRNLFGDFLRLQVLTHSLPCTWNSSMGVSNDERDVLAVLGDKESHSTRV